jgi:hypothetical protein
VTGEWLPPQPPGGQPPQAPPQAPEPAPPPEAPQPPPGYPPPGYQQYGWQPPPPQPPNNDAVAGFVCGIIGVSLLFFTAGLSTILSLILGIVAIPFSRKGKANVEEGRTQKHKSLASAGYVIGIVTVVLSLLATLVWVLLFTTLDSIDWEELEESNDNPFDEEFQFQVIVRAAAAAFRLLG